MSSMTTTSPDRARHRPATRRLAGVAAAIALVATGAVGAQSFADDEGDAGPPPPPGQQVVVPAPDAGADGGDLVVGSSELIVTSGSEFDSTVVSKMIPANAFQVLQGEGAAADTVRRDDLSCLAPADTSGGVSTELFAPVELPLGSRIKQVTFYGQDNDGQDITVRLYRQRISMPLAAFPAATRANSVVDSFSTSGVQAGASVVAGEDNLEELVGTFGGGGEVRTNFHTVKVELSNLAGTDHVLCGVKIDYQIPVSTRSGSVFHPVGPIRAFDSRQGPFAASGLLGPNETKVIDISDGYDSGGVVIPAQQGTVPATATAIAYNVTVAGATGSNFVAVTAGDAAGFTASTINYSGGSNVANASTVTVAADRTIKLWGGDGAGSAHVIIDVVGYYSPPAPSNMAN